MEFEKLAEYVKSREYLKTKWDVACFLIGYKGGLSIEDIDEIMRLYEEGIIA